MWSGWRRFEVATVFVLLVNYFGYALFRFMSRFAIRFIVMFGGVL